MTATMTRRDAHTQEAVVLELNWDTVVDNSAITVGVDSGVITLAGTVDSYAQKMAAEEAARRVSGVLDVVNAIEIKLTNRTFRLDVEITEAAQKVLEWDALIPEATITVSVTDGWVTMEGTVPTWSQREYAPQALRNLNGVRGITNEITVNTSQTDAEEVKQTIEEALERHAAREKEHIQVVFANGTVTLTGWVYNWSEKLAVLRAAGFARGVQNVEDNLRINPYF